MMLLVKRLHALSEFDLTQCVIKFYVMNSKQKALKMFLLSRENFNAEMQNLSQIERDAISEEMAVLNKDPIGSKIEAILILPDEKQKKELRKLSPTELQLMIKKADELAIKQAQKNFFMHEGNLNEQEAEVIWNYIKTGDTTGWDEAFGE